MAMEIPQTDNQLPNLMNSTPGKSKDLEHAPVLVDPTPHTTEKASALPVDGERAGRKTALVLLTSAVILLFFLMVDLDASKPKASKGAAVLTITALWWFTEVVPLTITSLLPMALYPLLGVVGAKELATKFLSSMSFLLIAGFFIGLAVERWELHKRIVCTLVAAMGRRVELMAAGFMLSVWLLSMWIPNTAAVQCMLPVARAFVATLPPGHERFLSAFFLATSYSATVGGIATPIGTPTNSVFVEQFTAFWPEAGEFSFAKFVFCALPLSALLLVVVWLGFCAIYVWGSKEDIPVDRELFKRLRVELGKVSWEQMVVSADLLLLMVLWFTASPIASFPGWTQYVSKELNPGAIGLAVTLPLFFIPCGWRLPEGLRRMLGEERCMRRTDDAQNILDWPAVRGNFTWEILFLFGGGMLIAHGTVKSKLAQWAAERLAEVEMGETGFILVVTLIICSVTEVVSNMSTLATFGSIVASTAHVKGYDQVQLLLAVTFAASFAFMLPMAGGPNMVVFATGKIDVRFMAKNGCLLNIASVLVGTLYIGCLMPSILGSYRHLPPPHAE